MISCALFEGCRDSRAICLISCAILQGDRVLVLSIQEGVDQEISRETSLKGLGR